MITWLTIIGMGLITYAIRLSPILLLERFELSPAVRQALKFVPVAVLSAIILPELVLPGGEVGLSLANGRLWAGIAAILVAWRTKNVLWTIAVGMIVLWLLP
jgi:branched-subunit amino acid transport protein